MLIVTENDLRSLSRLPPQQGVRGYVVKASVDRDLVTAVEAASKREPVSATTLRVAKKYVCTIPQRVRYFRAEVNGSPLLLAESHPFLSAVYTMRMIITQGARSGALQG